MTIKNKELNKADKTVILNNVIHWLNKLKTFMSVDDEFMEYLEERRDYFLKENVENRL
jgi:hypothetical protein